jgi:hypothetical protein
MYVPISKKIIDAVLWRVRTMREAELGTLGPMRLRLDDPESDLALQVIWGDKAHLRNEIPKEWLSTTDSAKISVDYTPVDEQKKYVIYVDFSGSWHVPADLTRYNTAKRDIDPDQHSAVKTVINNKNTQEQIEKRWSAVTNQLNSFLSACKSLNEALTARPEIRPYIPEEYIERINRKATKTVRDDTELKAKLETLDVDMLASSAVLARMAGANK